MKPEWLEALKPEWLHHASLAMAAATPANGLMQDLAKMIIAAVLSAGAVLYVSDAKQEERLRSIDATVSKIEQRLQRMEGDIYRPRWQAQPSTQPSMN